MHNAHPIRTRHVAALALSITTLAAMSAAQVGQQPPVAVPPDWVVRANPLGYSPYPNFSWTDTPGNNPVEVLWNQGIAVPGDRIAVRNGSYPHLSLDRVQGGATTRILPNNPGMVVWTMNPVGGSDTLEIKRGNDILFSNLLIEPDDRAAVMLSNTTVHSRLHFENCKVGLGSGVGWNAETDSGFRGKWGFLTYYVDDFVFKGGEVKGIGEEHAFYHHNVQAPDANSMAVSIEDAEFCWLGRTVVQVTARTTEGPKGRGTILVRGCYIEDVCLEQGGGGSALTFKGNHSGTVIIEDTVVRLGANPNLHPNVSGNITGALVMSRGSNAPTGTDALVIRDCDFQVGPVFVGVGSARRPNVNISHCKFLEITGTTITQSPGAREALVIGPAVGETDTGLPIPGSIVLSQSNNITGECVAEGQTHGTYAAMLTAVASNPKYTIVP